jgi:hypothetical protein
MKFMRRTKGCTRLYYNKNLDMTKELSGHPATELMGNYTCKGKPIFMESLSPEYRSKFSVSNRKDRDLQEDPTDTGMRPQEDNRLKTWKS